MYGKGTMIEKTQSYYSSALHQIAKSSAVVPLKVPSQHNATTTTWRRQSDDKNTTTTTRQRQQRDDENAKTRTWRQQRDNDNTTATTRRQRQHCDDDPGVASGHAQKSVITTAPGRAFQHRLTSRARTRVGEKNRTRASIPRPVNFRHARESVKRAAYGRAFPGQ